MRKKNGLCGKFGRLRTAGVVLCLGLYIVLCGFGGSGFVSPALAGENGTLLMWNGNGFREEYIAEIQPKAQTARVDFTVSIPGETLAEFLAGQNISGLDAPVILYWIPDHGSGWKNVGGYTLNEVSAMVQEAVGVLGGAKLDVTLLGSCYAGNIETMSCFAGLTERVLAYSSQSTISMVTDWLDWLKENPGKNDFADYVGEYFQGNFAKYGSWVPGQYADPEKLLRILSEVRRQDVPSSFFQNLLDDGWDYSVGVSDIWNLVEHCGVTGLLREAVALLVTPEDSNWEGICRLSCWNGENEDLYIATVPEANRCIPGSSVTPDEPTPVPEGAASGGGGGCMVGAHNFPALLLLIPLTVVMMKKGKK